MTLNDLKFELASEHDTAAVLAIAKNYPKDFETYIQPLPAMIEQSRVFVVKRGHSVLGFAAYGISDQDPRECITASARTPKISRNELSGDFIRTNLEEALRKKGFRTFTAHVRPANTSAIKMLLRNGYKRVENPDALQYGLIEYSKTV